MKSATKLFIPIAFLTLLAPAAARSQTRPQDGGRVLLTPTNRAGTVRQQEDPTVIRSQNVIVDFRPLRGGQNLVVPLFEGERLRLERERLEQVRKDGLVWHGRVAGEPRSAAALATVGEALIGNIVTEAGRVYQIRYLGGGVHSLRQIDQSKFPNEAQPRLPERQTGTPQALGDTCNTDPPSDIDVMMVYTDDARVGAGGNDAILATVYLALAETNQAYLNSNINQRLRLVHVEEVNYNESSNNINTYLNNLANTDSVIDQVQNLRNTFAADLVQMITESGGGACGLGYFMNNVSNTFEAFAYSVVARACATGYYSSGHEFGHNMGADHDCANATSSGPYSYNRGYVETTPSAGTPWRTIMSYQSSPGSTRIPYWSHPGVNYPVGNDPMGGPCPNAVNSTDNHLVLNNTALTVANFRCTSPGVNNVWMKDTWNDTGAEPDSHTAGEDMWLSPYIWVRLAQDTGLVSQHQHQNPEFGQTNFVYVKLHNGSGASASGNLELYVANASTGLTWPTDWTALPPVAVSGFAAHTSRVVETTWSPPGVGHYCMIARWNSAADPMTVPETGDINANTRNNNNIVWRNLNIVNLADEAMDASLWVRNSSRQRAVTALDIRPPRREAENSFLRHGQIVVQLDEKLLSAWRQGGGKGSGFKYDGRAFVLTGRDGATFENLVLPPGFAGQVRLLFRRTAATPRRQFVINVTQTEETQSRHEAAPNERPQLFKHSKRRVRVVGGVSYEIRTDLPPGSATRGARRAER